MKKSIFGILIMMESLFLGLSLLVALLYCEPCWKVFLGTAAFAFVLGSCFKYLGEREKSDRFTRSDSYLVVALSWIIFSASDFVSPPTFSAPTMGKLIMPSLSTR